PLQVILSFPTRRSSDLNIELLFKQCIQYKPAYVVVSTEKLADNLRQRLRERSLSTEVLFGAKALADVASLSEVDTVMAAIVGAADRKSTRLNSSHVSIS